MPWNACAVAGAWYFLYGSWRNPPQLREYRRRVAGKPDKNPAFKYGFGPPTQNQESEAQRLYKIDQSFDMDTALEAYRSSHTDTIVDVLREYGKATKCPGAVYFSRGAGGSNVIYWWLGGRHGYHGFERDYFGGVIGKEAIIAAIQIKASWFHLSNRWYRPRTVWVDVDTRISIRKGLPQSDPVKSALCWATNVGQTVKPLHVDSHPRPHRIEAHHNRHDVEDHEAFRIPFGVMSISDADIQLCAGIESAG